MGMHLDVTDAEREGGHRLRASYCHLVTGGLMVRFASAGVGVVVAWLVLTACGSNPEPVSTSVQTSDAEESPPPWRSEAGLPDFRLQLMCNTSNEIERVNALIRDFKIGTAAGIDIAEGLDDLQVTMGVLTMPLDEDSPILAPGQIDQFEAAQQEILRKRAAFINDPTLPIELAEEAVSVAEAAFQEAIGTECESISDLD